MRWRTHDSAHLRGVTIARLVEQVDPLALLVRHSSTSFTLPSSIANYLKLWSALGTVLYESPVHNCCLECAVSHSYARPASTAAANS